MEIPRRSKEVSWASPADVLPAFAGMSFPAYLQAVADGRLPNSPAIELAGITLLSIGKGAASVAFVPEEIHVNSIGAVHGGVIATVLDSTIGYAVQTTLVANERFVTTQLGVNFIKGIAPGGTPLRAHAHLRHRGSRVVFAEATLEDHAGTIYATATATCLVMKPPG